MPPAPRGRGYRELVVSGKVGVPQGGPFSPLAANIYLNEVDWFYDAIRRKTAEGAYEAVNYHRFADDIVITVSGHHTKRGWAERALQRLQEQIAPLGVELNVEKTKMVNTLKGLGTREKLPTSAQIESSTRGARHESQKPLAVPVQLAARIEAAKASQVMAEVTLARSCP